VTDPDHHGDADPAPGRAEAVDVRAGTPPPWLRAVLHEALADAHGRPVEAVPLTAVRDPATSVALAADRAAILDPGTPAFQDLPRLPEEIR